MINSYGQDETKIGLTSTVRSALTFPAPPVNVQRCSWPLGGILLSVSCLGTCMSCTCCAEEADKDKNTPVRDPNVSALSQELNVSSY